mgnify:CR=1 FL=1
MRKLLTEFQQGIKNQSVLERKYTLTHSDETGELFLYVGSSFLEERFSVLRDEVVGKWRLIDNIYSLWLICNLDCASSNYSPKERLAIFEEHIQRVVQIIKYGDQEYIKNHHLYNANIYVSYRSSDPALQNVQCLGTLHAY